MFQAKSPQGTVDPDGEETRLHDLSEFFNDDGKVY